MRQTLPWMRNWRFVVNLVIVGDSVAQAWVTMTLDKVTMRPARRQLFPQTHSPLCWQDVHFLTVSVWRGVL